MVLWACDITPYDIIPKVCVFTLVKMHALFRMLSGVSGVVSQQSAPLRFSVRSFGCALFYCRRKWNAGHTKNTTEELQPVLRDDAEKAGHVRDADFLYEVMGDLARRSQESGLKRKTDLEAWQEFLKYYAPDEFLHS
jgi:hypothetical protein